MELLAALVRGGTSTAESAFAASGALPVCLKLFVEFPFNNLLHHNVASMLIACASSADDGMLEHTFGACAILEWIARLPVDVGTWQRRVLMRASTWLPCLVCEHGGVDDLFGGGRMGRACARIQ